MSMMKIKIAAAAVMLSASVVVTATPLSEYNIILSDDFNVSGGSGHVEGKSFIGGDLVNGSVFAMKEDKLTLDNTVEVVGDVTANQGMHIDAGYIAYSGNTNVDSSWNGICNGNGFSNDDCFRHVAGNELVDKKDALLTELALESAYYSSLSTSAGSGFSGDINNRNFVYSGAATDLAVFTIDAADLANVNWGLDMGNAANVLINVTGSIFDAGWAHVNGFQNYSSNVLWNFADATELHFGDSWYGSVLALNADIYTNSNLNGAIAARSYLGNGEIHTFNWTYEPPTGVSEPASLLLGVAAMGLLAARRRKLV